jgi:hypothetical protein
VDWLLNFRPQCTHTNGGPFGDDGGEDCEKGGGCGGPEGGRDGGSGGGGGAELAVAIVVDDLLVTLFSTDVGSVLHSRHSSSHFICIKTS